MHGQKGFNGVAILSKRPFDEIAVRGLPGDDERRARPLHRGVRAAQRRRGAHRQSLPAERQSRSAPTSSPTSSPGCSASRPRTRELLDLEEPFLLLGDYNVIPEPIDAKNPEAWTGDALYQPETRAAYRALLNLGLTDVRARLPAGARRLHLLGLSGRRLAEGPRHPHRPHPGLARRRPTGSIAGGIDKHTRAWEKPSDHVPVWVEMELD